MVKAAVEQIFDGSISQVAIGGSYDATKINRGAHTGQYNLGTGEVDKYIGPSPLGAAFIGESSLAIPAAFVHPVQVTSDLYWIFANDNATAAATRRIQLWTWVPSTNTYTFIGAITATFPTTGNVTSRGLRALLENYTTGTVAVSGTAVTGSGTAWNTGLSVGSRIGFGSTNPAQITTWYEISAIGSDTSITLSTSAGTISSGTPYVIQDLMIIHAHTNSTATNGGLFVIKGLQFADFQNPAKTIPAATTVDKIKAVYWIKDAATVTNTVIGGCAVTGRDSWTQQYAYCCNGSSTSLIVYRYNFRAPLTPTSGAFTLTGTDIVITGTQTVTGNVLQLNNGRVATLSHGPGSGVSCLYMLTSTRVLRIPIANITSGNTTFVADSMTEVPPGGTNTNIATGSFVSMDVASSIDKLVIMGAAATGTLYITNYSAAGAQMDRRANCLTSQLPSSNRDSDSPIFVHTISGQTPTVWVEGGWLFWMYSSSTTTNTNALTVYPLAADWEYTASVNNRIICPKINLGSVPSKLYRLLVNCAENIGDSTMGLCPDAYKVQYRTSGIDDNTGAWIDVPQTGNLSGVSPSASIQFAFLFRTAGVIMLPARILSIALVYETADALPSQYQWNFSDFNASNGTFAWVQDATFGASLTTHTISIYRADTDALVLTQASTSTVNGTFEYWNGSAWVSGLGSDTIGTRRRFVPSGSLPTGVDLYAKIQVA